LTGSSKAGATGLEPATSGVIGGDESVVPTVSVYQHRHEDMPRPVLNLGNGRVKLWLRPEVERWAADQARPTRRGHSVNQ
jgi:hypothetical protein